MEELNKLRDKICDQETVVVLLTEKLRIEQMKLGIFKKELESLLDRVVTQ